MKRYRLLKDLPFAKAGEELYLKFSEDSEFFLVYKGTDKAYTTELNPEFIDNFDEWFEEAEELKKYYYIGSMGHVENTEYKGWELSVRLRKMMGNYFETYEETERHIDYLLAKEVIKQDAKGFKPDWKDKTQAKYFGCWDSLMERKRFDYEYTFKNSEIYFQSEEDIEESFKKHPDEWKTYLTYNQ